jgi:WD40 repeat protein
MMSNNEMINKVTQEEEVTLDLEKEQELLKNQLIEMKIKKKKVSERKLTCTEVTNFNKSSSYELDGDFRNLLELSDGTIPCWTTEGIKLLKFEGHNLETIKNFPGIFSYFLADPIQQNENIIYQTGPNQLTITDKNLEVIECLKESMWIESLCIISDVSFAIGLSDGQIKIYSRNSDTQKYEVVKEYQYHSDGVISLVYLPKQDYLVSGSRDKTINVLNLCEGKSVKTLTGHNDYVYSLISINDETFASGSWDGEIKVWSINAEIECVKTIKAHEYCGYRIYLYLLTDDFMISRLGNEFIIWDVKTYECLKNYKDDSVIQGLIITKNQNIITGTDVRKVNVWQI